MWLFFQSTIWKRARSFFARSISLGVCLFYLFVCSFVASFCLVERHGIDCKIKCQFIGIQAKSLHIFIVDVRTQKNHISRTNPSMKYDPALFQRYGTKKKTLAGEGCGYPLLSLFDLFKFRLLILCKTLTIFRPLHRN